MSARMIRRGDKPAARQLSAYPYEAPYPFVEEELGSEPTTETLDEARETGHHLAEEAGIGAESRGEFGDPTATIIDAADEHNADVIVVGATDKSWWRRMIDGSVSNELVRGSTRPVLIGGRAHR